MFNVILLLCITALTYGHRIRQCTCNEIQPCSNVDARTIFTCADKCQVKGHAAKSGVSYPALRMCYQEIESTINAVFGCVRDKLSNSCSKVPPPLTVRQFNPTLFKVELIKEVITQLKASGIKHEVIKYFLEEKEYSKCRLECFSDEALKCLRERRCGLVLPSNRDLVLILKQCALPNGMGTAGFRKLCRCKVKAGA
ncbi:hypothetical protein NECAME_03242, partial [Necator americanus]